MTVECRDCGGECVGPSYEKTRRCSDCYRKRRKTSRRSRDVEKILKQGVVLETSWDGREFNVLASRAEGPQLHGEGPTVEAAARVAVERLENYEEGVES